MLKIDLHVHTQYSDGDKINKILKYATLRGIDGVAITDHNTTKGIKSIKKKDILIIPGVEIKSEIGHFLILGVQEETYFKDTSFDEITDYCKENDCVLVFAHPAISLIIKGRKIIKKLNKHKSSINAIEVFNSLYPMFKIMSRLSLSLAYSLGDVALVAGSDAHHASSVGKCYTLIDAEEEVDEVLKAIKNKKTIPKGEPSFLFQRLPIIPLTLKSMLV